MLNITITAESETIANLIALLRDMADDMEKTCINHKDYKETELAHGIWLSSHLGEIEFQLDDGKRTTLGKLYDTRFHD
jgi:hypothetical protein